MNLMLDLTVKSDRATVTTMNDCDDRSRNRSGRRFFNLQKIDEFHSILDSRESTRLRKEIFFSLTLDMVKLMTLKGAQGALTLHAGDVQVRTLVGWE